MVKPNPEEAASAASRAIHSKLRTTQTAACLSARRGARGMAAGAAAANFCRQTLAFCRFRPTESGRQTARSLARNLQSKAYRLFHTLTMLSALDREFAPLQTALDLRAQRQQLLAVNIANADTPGYKAVDLDFAAAYRAALAGQSPAALPLKTEQPRHLPGIAAQPTDGFIGYQAGNAARLDGNTVDMNREQAAFQKNSIQYEADLTFLTGKIKTLTSAITGN